MRALLSQEGLFMAIWMLALSPEGGLATRGGFLHFEVLCYQNPGNLDSNGNMCDPIISKTCDPYFDICISNMPIRADSPASCPVYQIRTVPFTDQDVVCNQPYDSRNSLKGVRIIDLPKPIQEEYYVRIVVQDFNSITAFQNIAIFTARFSGRPSANKGNFIQKEIKMGREEGKIHNPKAKLLISIGLQCDKDLYGNVCNDLCRPGQRDAYYCSENGKKICRPGWMGSECNRKDFCHTFMCAKGAQCTYQRNKPVCSCNGNFGPECYPGYNPCQPNPCLHGGQCRPQLNLSRVAVCTCKPFFYGSNCEHEFDVCQRSGCTVEDCVVSRNVTHTCKCLSKQKRIVCVHNFTPPTPQMHNFTLNGTGNVFASKRQKDKSIGVAFGVSFAIAILGISIAGIMILRRRRNKKKKSNMAKVENGYGQLPLVTLPRRLSNEYDQFKDDCQYEKIDDGGDEEEDMDEYLVPSRPITPVMTPGGRSDNSSYMTMANNDRVYMQDPITVGNTKENEYRPPLPTRTAKKTIFNFFRFPQL